MDKALSIVITGEARRSEAFKERLASAIPEADIFCIETVSFARAALAKEEEAIVRSTPSFDYLFFSSARAAHSFATLLRAEGIAPKDAPGAVAVGPVTARACEEEGFRVQAIPEEYAAVRMAETIGGIKGAKILFPRSDIAPEDTITSINKSGAVVTPLTIYRTLPRQTPLSAEEGAEVSAATHLIFMSPSSIRSFAALLGKSESRVTADAVAVCIGPRTERIAREYGFKTVMATAHTADGIMKILKERI